MLGQMKLPFGTVRITESPLWVISHRFNCCQSGPMSAMPPNSDQILRASEMTLSEL